jgi:hypothetical protein
VVRRSPFVAGAVHDGGDAPVEQPVLLLKGADVERAGAVVHAAALVGAAEAAQVAEAIGHVALSTPLGARHSQHVHQVAFPPKETAASELRTRSAPALFHRGRFIPGLHFRPNALHFLFNIQYADCYIRSRSFYICTPITPHKMRFSLNDSSPFYLRFVCFCCFI